MSTKFYVGQKDYIAKLNEIDDLLQSSGSGGTNLSVGDVILTSRALAAPEYLPMAGDNYLQASYPALFAELGLQYDSRAVLAGTQRTLPALLDWSSIAYGNGVFVAVASSSPSVATSSDGGVTWTLGSIPGIDGWASRVEYGNGLFVAITIDSDIVTTSPDGVNWTQRTLPAAVEWTSLAYGGGLWVVLASYSNIVATSPDGVTWTQQTLPATQGWSSVAFGNGLFVVMASDYAAATSPDGINWTLRAAPGRVAGDSSLVHGNGVFVALLNNPYYAATSLDGVIWDVHTLPAVADWFAITFADGLFMAVAYGSSIAAASPDGVNWTQKVLPASDHWYSATIGGGVFISVAYGSATASVVNIISYNHSTHFHVPLARGVVPNLVHYIKAT